MDPKPLNSVVNPFGFNSAAVFSLPSTSPFSLQPHPPSVLDCLLDTDPAPLHDSSADEFYEALALPPQKRSDTPDVQSSALASGIIPCATAGYIPVGTVFGRPLLHDAVQWSADDKIAVLGALEVEIIDIVPPNESRSLSPGVAHIEILPLPNTSSALPMPVSVISARWSPTQCSPVFGCLLSIVLSDGSLLVYSESAILTSSWVSCPLPTQVLSKKYTASDWSRSFIENRAYLGAATASGQVFFLVASKVMRHGDDPILTQVSNSLTVPDKSKITIMRISHESDGAMLLAVATVQFAIHIYRSNAMSDTCVSLELIHTIIGPSPVAAIRKMEFSAPCSSSVKLAYNFGSSIGITEYGTAVSSTQLTLHGHLGSITGLAWSRDGAVITCSCSTMHIKTWKHDSFSNLIVPLNDTFSPITQSASLATSELIDYCDDDEHSNIHLQGHFGIGSSPDLTMAAVVIPILTTTMPGRSGKASSKPDLLFSIYAYPISSDLGYIADATCSSLCLYPNNVQQCINVCHSLGECITLAEEYESQFSVSGLQSLLALDERSVELASLLRAANIVRWSLMKAVVPSGKNQLHRDAIAQNLDLLVRVHVLRILTLFTSHIRSWQQQSQTSCCNSWATTVILIRRWVMLQNDRDFYGLSQNALEAMEVVITTDSSLPSIADLAEFCPLCCSEVPLTNLLNARCINGHFLKRCRLTLQILPLELSRRCLICAGSCSFPQESDNWSTLHPLGPLVCPLCFTHLD